jgi:hypothetical protein
VVQTRDEVVISGVSLRGSGVALANSDSLLRAEDVDIVVFGADTTGILAPRVQLRRVTVDATGSNTAEAVSIRGGGASALSEVHESLLVATGDTTYAVNAEGSVTVSQSILRGRTALRATADGIVHNSLLDGEDAAAACDLTADLATLRAEVGVVGEAVLSRTVVVADTAVRGVLQSFDDGHADVVCLQARPSCQVTEVLVCGMCSGVTEGAAQLDDDAVPGPSSPLLDRLTLASPLVDPYGTPRPSDAADVGGVER